VLISAASWNGGSGDTSFVKALSGQLPPLFDTRNVDYLRTFTASVQERMRKVLRDQAHLLDVATQYDGMQMPQAVHVGLERVIEAGKERGAYVRANFAQLQEAWARVRADLMSRDVRPTLRELVGRLMWGVKIPEIYDQEQAFLAQDLDIEQWHSYIRDIVEFSHTSE
jgi:hypothetical protein